MSCVEPSTDAFSQGFIWMVDVDINILLRCVEKFIVSNVKICYYKCYYLSKERGSLGLAIDIEKKQI